MLTDAAFNALLKTLEEPPPHVVFMLATTEAHKVPATVALALPALRLPSRTTGVAGRKPRAHLRRRGHYG